MPYLEKRKGGHVVRWREGGRETKLLCTPLYERKDKALEKARELKAQVSARRPLKAGADLKMDEILQRYRVRRESQGARDIHLEKAHKRLMSMCKENNWTTPRSVTPASVEKWRQDGGSPRAGAYLRAALRWAMETLDQAVDPRALIALRPRANRRRPKASLITDAQLATWQAKADECGENAGALIHCLSTYGWRPITAADLKVSDLDLADGTITTAVKGGDIVRHPLLPETLRRLSGIAEGRKPGEHLFLDPRKNEKGPQPWSPDSSRRGSIIDWCRTVLGLKSYDLKRLAISRMLARGLPPQTVALFTGHRTISQVLAYARTNDEKARAALAVMGDDPKLAMEQPARWVAPLAIQ
jgi:hypothetical protein